MKWVVSEFHGKIHSTINTFKCLTVQILRNRREFICKWKSKNNLTNVRFMPVKPFATPPGPLKGCNSSWPDVSICVLIQMDIFRICCKFRLEKNMSSTVIKLGTCILNVLCHLYIKYFKVNAFIFNVIFKMGGGHTVAQLVEALRYKPEGRGFVPRWSHWNFSLT
jgi:hypothetical protein